MTRIVVFTVSIWALPVFSGCGPSEQEQSRRATAIKEKALATAADTSRCKSLRARQRNMRDLSESVAGQAPSYDAGGGGFGFDSLARSYGEAAGQIVMQRQTSRFQAAAEVYGRAYEVALQEEAWKLMTPTERQIVAKFYPTFAKVASKARNRR